MNAVDKARIVAYLEDSRIMTDLAAKFGVGAGTIWRIRTKLLHEGTVKRKDGSTRPKASIFTTKPDEY